MTDREDSESTDGAIDPEEADGAMDEALAWDRVPIAESGCVQMLLS